MKNAAIFIIIQGGYVDKKYEECEKNNDDLINYSDSYYDDLIDYYDSYFDDYNDY